MSRRSNRGGIKTEKSDAFTPTSADAVDSVMSPSETTRSRKRAADALDQGGAADSGLRSERLRNMVSADKKKRKLQPRCTSPSHFLVDPDEEKQFGPEFTHDNPDRLAIDTLMRSVATLYYRPRELNQSQSSVIANAEYDVLQYTTLDTLLSPLRRPHILDSWSPKEIALFESGICALGKNFNGIQKLIKTKTTNEIVEFYYNWKKSSHYQMWKEFGKPVAPFSSQKEGQWNAIADKMKGFK